jgi:post-segregation antitoxin (ccd killing protein)
MFSTHSVYEPDLVITVPSLLKRWKRLDAGLEASSDAYEALSKHFEHKTEQWLEEDKLAQKNRQKDPTSMDIYDTVKQKGMCIMS